MDVGVVFPQLEIGTDPGTVREFATTAESHGFDHLYAYDHVLGANPDRPGWSGAYDYEDPFHEPLTVFANLAGPTDQLTFVTGILVLPQRQTALVAKQATEVDVLSEGRLRLGVAIGWNDVEYEALGMEYSTRGRRIEEQIEVLRRLWTHELVTFEGEFHSLPDVGLNPLPTQRPIPIWMGGTDERVLERVGRLADGYLPQFEPGADGERTLAKIRTYAKEAGRDPQDIGVHGRLRVRPGEESDWVEGLTAWSELGADYVALNPMYNGLEGEDHVDFLDRMATVLRASEFLDS